jgi:DNA end-binding protein Ku
MLAALASTERVGIGRMVWHGKENLVAIRARGGLLMMETMQFADEVVPLQPLVDELALPAPDPKQLKLAEQLIASLEAPFDPAQYANEQRGRVLKAIEEKQSGKQIVLAPTPAAAPRTSDLMAALEASLQATTKRRAPAAKAKEPAAHAPAKRRRPVA